MESVVPFRRANFFPGLLATPKFWNEIQQYHVAKEQFYNAVFQGAGVVPGVMDSLKVQSLAKGGGTTLVVSPGCALDGKGRPLFVYEPQALVLDYKRFKLPCTVYLVASYDEVFEEFFQNPEIPDYQGYMKKLEKAKLDVVSLVQDPQNQIELARIALCEDENGEVGEILNGNDYAAPGTNTLDFRYVQWVSPAKKGISPYLKAFFVELLEASRNTAMAAYDTFPLLGLREMQSVALTAKMLVQCGDVHFNDLIHILFPLFDVDSQILQQMLEYERENEKRLFSVKESFDDVRQAVFQMGDLIKYFDHKYEQLDAILKSHRAVLEGLKKLIVTRQVTMDAIMLISYELPRVLLLGDDRFTLVDYLDLAQKEGIDFHGLSFLDCQDVATANQSGSYPDGVMVRDTIKRYVGGVVRFQAKNIIKKRKLLLVRRTDVYKGDYTVEVTINGQHSRTLNIDYSDTRDRWRNLIVLFEEDEITDNSVQIEFKIGEKGRDNFGKMWMYQCV